MLSVYSMANMDVRAEIAARLIVVNWRRKDDLAAWWFIHESTAIEPDAPNTFPLGESPLIPQFI